MTQNKYFTRKEVAILLKCSLSTVDRGIRDKIYPYNTVVKIGRRAVRFPAYIFLEFSGLNPELAGQSVASNITAISCDRELTGKDCAGS